MAVVGVDSQAGVVARAGVLRNGFRVRWERTGGFPLVASTLDKEEGNAKGEAEAEECDEHD